MAKGWKVTIIIVSILLITIIMAGSVYFFWPWHKNFFNNADEEFEIPGLDTSFCPQGMTELPEHNRYIISGYMDDGSPSRYYVIDSETKEVEKCVTLTIDGKDYTGHAGGVATHNNSIWTVSSESTGDGYAYRFEVNDLMSAEDGAKIEVKGKFKTLNNADYVFVYDNIVWVGEFYKPEKYETNDEHHIVTRSGETNRAMIYGFQTSNWSDNGVTETYPVKAISVGDLCQGIAITGEGNFVLSTSYSIPDSNILYYKAILKEDAHDTYKPGLKEIPLWYLDNESLLNKVTIPSMSEEIIMKNNRVYILFESACKKYKLFNRTRIKSVYSVPVNFLEK